MAAVWWGTGWLEQLLGGRAPRVPLACGFRGVLPGLQRVGVPGVTENIFAGIGTEVTAARIYSPLCLPPGKISPGFVQGCGWLRQSHRTTVLFMRGIHPSINTPTGKAAQVAIAGQCRPGGN